MQLNEKQIETLSSFSWESPILAIKSKRFQYELEYLYYFFAKPNYLD